MRLLQIETNTNCNLACWFCPNSRFRQKKAEHMGMEMFKNILEQYVEVFPDRLISFADYNEPTLDPLFYDRLNLVNQMGFSYWFISNGSNIPNRLLNFIRDNDIRIHEMHLNIPSANIEELAELTNSTKRVAEKTLAQLRSIGEFAEVFKFPVSIAFHSKDPNGIQDFEKFTRGKITVNHAGVFDRAGYLKDIPGVTHDTYHLSCSINNTENIYVDVHGDLFLCCNDYLKKTKYGSALTLKESFYGLKKQNKLVDLKKDLCVNCVYAKPE